MGPIFGTHPPREKRGEGTEPINQGWAQSLGPPEEKRGKTKPKSLHPWPQTPKTLNHNPKSICFLPQGFSSLHVLFHSLSHTSINPIQLERTSRTRFATYQGTLATLSFARLALYHTFPCPLFPFHFYCTLSGCIGLLGLLLARYCKVAFVFVKVWVFFSKTKRNLDFPFGNWRIWSKTPKTKVFHVQKGCSARLFSTRGPEPIP